MRPGCCDGCCAASLACVRSRRAAVRWMVCAHAKDALPAHAPATVGLDALLPAAGATHGPADELQQRARCSPVAYTRSTSCSRRISRRQRHDAAKRASHYPPRATQIARLCALCILCSNSSSTKGRYWGCGDTLQALVAHVRPRGYRGAPDTLAPAARQRCAPRARARASAPAACASQ